MSQENNHSLNEQPGAATSQGIEGDTSVQRGVGFAGNPQDDVSNRKDQSGVSEGDSVPAPKVTAQVGCTPVPPSAKQPASQITAAGSDGQSRAQEPAPFQSPPTQQDEKQDTKKTDTVPAPSAPPEKGKEPASPPTGEEKKISNPEPVKGSEEFPPQPETEKVKNNPPPVTGQGGETSTQAPANKAPEPAATQLPTEQQGTGPTEAKSTESGGAGKPLTKMTSDSATPPVGEANDKEADTKVTEATSEKSARESVSKTKGKTNGEIVPYKTPEEKAKAVEEIRELHGEILNEGQHLWSTFKRTSMPKCQRIGEVLFSLKESVAHGEWESYVEKTVGIEPRTASNYMRLYRERDRLPKSETGSDWGIKGALKLLGKPKKNKTTRVLAVGNGTREAESAQSVSGPKDVVEPTKSKSSGNGAGTGETADQGPAEEKRTEEPLIVLADDVAVTLSSLGWVDGFISWPEMEKILGGLTSNGQTLADKSAIVKRQRKLVQIAGSHNRVIPKDCAYEDVRGFLAEMDTVKKMIETANKKRRKK